MTIRIVLADDHGVVREGVQLLLEAQPDMVVVGHAATGREAVRTVQQLEPDVAVFDIAMPELNGLVATRQILQSMPHVRIIILSMHATKRYVLEALQAGTSGYVLKESVSRELVEAVRTVYAGRRHLSSKVSEQLIDSYLADRTGGELPDPLSLLSARELEVLQLVVEGNSSAEIAQLLLLSPKTVDTYRSRLMHKLGVHDMPGLVKFAIRHGVTSLE